MDTTDVRRAGRDDLPALARLRRADAVERKDVPADAEPGFEERFADWFGSTGKDRVIWLAQTAPGSVAVGMLQLFAHHRMPMPDRDTGGWGYVGVLFVVPERRGAGLGRLLLDTAISYAEERGLRRLLLHPTERAVPLYRRAGFMPADHILVRPVHS